MSEMTKEKAEQILNEAEAAANRKYKEATKTEAALYEPHRIRWLEFAEPHFKTMLNECGKARTQWINNMSEIPNQSAPKG